MVATEMVMMQLRLYEGLSISVFSDRVGATPHAVFGGTLERLTELGVLTASDSHVALTNRGRLVANAVMAELTTAAADWCAALSAP
jgi:oxygen-independent coproporphyrinogen-3 oxidase